MLLSLRDKKRFIKDGIIIKNNILSERLVEDLRTLVLKLAQRERKVGQSYIYLFDSTGSTQRVWNLINKGKQFRSLLEMPIINEFMNFVFDRKTRHQKFLLSSFQANLISPGSERQKLHVDTPVPEPLPPWPMKANSIWLLDDFTDKNGATEYVPGSHLSPLKPTAIDDRDVKTMQACAPAGSVIFTHGALWHRAGANKCQGIRVGLLGSFSASYALEIAREEDQSLILDKDTISDMSDNLKRIIGIGHGIKNGARVRAD